MRRCNFFRIKPSQSEGSNWTFLLVGRNSYDDDYDWKIETEKSWMASMKSRVLDAWNSRTTKDELILWIRRWILGSLPTEARQEMKKSVNSNHLLLCFIPDRSTFHVLLVQPHATWLEVLSCLDFFPAEIMRNMTCRAHVQLESITNEYSDKKRCNRGHAECSGVLSW